ncbi:MAG: hypothetical protein HY565_05605 [Candidatus Kerfeldbacteria bacterium]|nr:hypothetical protein [Candidatus Kerfeldbacteria bacterium]
MKPYVLPLLMQTMSCGVDENEPPVVVSHPMEATAPVRESVTPVPDLQNESLRPVYPGAKDSDGMVRGLNPRERREAKAVIERARFLTPYAVQLANDSVLAKPQSEYTGEELDVLYGQFIDKAEQAVQNGRLLVEPALASQAADGLNRSVIIEEEFIGDDGNIASHVKEQYSVYTFGDDVNTWNVGIVIHEVAHDTFPLAHTIGMPMPSEERGQHILKTNDQVYGVSELFSVLDAPLSFVHQTIAEARSGQVDPQKTLMDLTLMKDAPDAEWSRMFLDGVYTSYQGFLPDVEITREELEMIYADPQYREYYRDQMNEEIDEFAAEVNMTEAELGELQQRYQIDETSDEFWGSMFMTVTVADGRPDAEIAAEHERQRQKHLKRIDTVNAAVRRTRDWK